MGTTYKTTELSKAFPAAFLEALLRLAGGPGGAVLQRILHTLLDRRGNAARLALPTSVLTCSSRAMLSWYLVPAGLRIDDNRQSEGDMIITVPVSP